MKIVLFRVDGNEIIATGHVMRCLSIAKKVEKHGNKAVFVTADKKASEFITSSGYENIVLESAWNDMENELPKFYEVINDFSKENEIVALLVDSYYVTKNYFSELRKHIKQYQDTTKLFYLDDLNAQTYDVDILINYNIYGDEFGYDSSRYKETYLGTKYVPLRDEFENISSRSFKKVKKLLITSGGTDEYDIIGKLLEAMVVRKEFSDFEYYCVLGRFNKNRDVLNLKYKNTKNVHLLNNISNMSYYMNSCDVAVTAGGSTCYELCACGIPAVSFTFADNQISGANTFSDRGIISYAGDVRNGVNDCINNIMNEIIILEEKTTWEKRSAIMQSVVDGKGASRLAEILTR